MKEVKSFTIDRSEWLPRSVSDSLSVDTKLWNDNIGRGCCLGLYLKACGINKKNLNAGMPIGLDVKIPKWLLTSDGRNSAEACALAKVNDRLDEEEIREQLIAEGFAAQGIRVTFKGELFPTPVKKPRKPTRKASK